MISDVFLRICSQFSQANKVAGSEKQILDVDPPPHWGRKCHSFGAVLRTCIRMDDTSGGGLMSGEEN